MTDAESSTPIHRLLDAIESIQANHKAEAIPILRELIGANNNFEEAWLWMSVAVESMDQSLICLDNVLRINPHNETAIRAQLRLREMQCGLWPGWSSTQIYAALMEPLDFSLREL